MLARRSEVSLRGWQNTWVDGCTTLVPRLLKSHSASRRQSGHGVYSKDFGFGGMLPERSDSLFSKPWSCQQCIPAWMQCHRIRVTTSALHSYWFRCLVSCCKVVRAPNRGMMYEGITAVGPTCKCSKKWACLLLPLKGVSGDCCGGKTLSKGLMKMLHCSLVYLGSFLGELRAARS